MGRPQLTRAAWVVLALAAPSVARAQPASPAPSAPAQTAQDKAAAQASFEEGKRLMVAHAYSEACPKFADSLRHDPGLGTMLGLADCFEKNGQTASAWAEFKEAAGTAARKNDRREALARQNAARLEPLLSKVLVRVPAETDVQGLLVNRDGVELSRASWGEAIPVDPGVHAVSASAPGCKDWQTTVNVVGSSTVETVTIPRLEQAPLPVVVTPLPTAPPEPLTVLSPSPAEPPSKPETSNASGRSQRIAAVAVGGAGVVSVVIGSIFGLRAKSKLDDSNANGHCLPGNNCDQSGIDLRNSAHSAATVSTVTFILGGAAIAGGAVLWFTAPKPDHASLGLAPAPSGALLTGRF